MMLDAVTRLFTDPSGLTPHGFCLLWEPGLLWAFAVSDAATTLAYFGIPYFLLQFANRRKDFVFRPLLWLSAMFILLCGTSHALDVLTLWVPAYGVQAVVKAAAALVSLATLAVFWRFMPLALALPSSAQLRAANTALHRSEARYRGMFEYSPFPMYVLDASNTVTKATNSFLSLLGCGSSDVIGHSIHEFWAPGVGPPGSTRLRLMADGEIHEAEQHFRRRDGSLFEALVSGHVEHRDDCTLAVYGVVDVTDRRRSEAASQAAWEMTADRIKAEEALRRSNEVRHARVEAQQLQHAQEERFSFAMQAARLGAWELELQTRELAASPMCMDIFGCARDSPFSFADMMNAVHPDDRHRMEAAFDHAIATGGDYDTECRIVRSNGVTAWIQMQAQIVQVLAGATPRMSGILLDITERHLAQERIRQSQQLEAVGRLTAGVAHDFNNVLQALLGGIELAIEGAVDRPDLRTDLELSLQAGRRGARLTSHLLSFSRQQTLRPAALDLPPLLDELSRTLARTLGHTIQLEVKAVASLPHVFVDGAHLDSALLNLALNARDAMPDGGDLVIEATATADHVALSVSDTGSGMTSEVLAQACEPFFSTKGPKGSGLGLSMVQGFARQSNGELRIESVVGLGTRITLNLPLAGAVPAPAPGRKTVSVVGQGRVLVVDDEVDVGRITGLFLVKAGYEVVTVNSADRALEVLAGPSQFDAVVTDFAMPGMDGAELVLRARDCCAMLPAVVITGYAGADRLDRLPGGVAVLHKPFHREQLARMVKRVIDAAKQPDGAGAPHAGEAADRTVLTAVSPVLQAVTRTD
jgi:PAS domain S-box-containing protein